MRAAIYGAGSLGTVLGAYITKNGGEIDLINHNAAHVAALREKGAHITGMVDFTVPVRALLPEEMAGTYDVILLLTKQLRNAEVAAFLRPYLKADGVLATLQNGLPEPPLAEVLGAERTLGCTVEWGATLVGPGESALTSDPGCMAFHMGRMAGMPEENYARVRALLERMCPVAFEENFLGVRWSKLLVNAVFSGLGTVIGGRFGDVSGSTGARRVAIRTIRECVDVGRAAGVRFAPMQGKDITRFFYYKTPLKRAFAMALMPLAMKNQRGIEPSMLQDLKKRKPCEIQAINGVVCREGRAHGVPTPFNDRIVEIVEREQAGELLWRGENIRLFDGLL